MNFKKVIKELPLLPTSAFIFYISLILLGSLEIIPSPMQILGFLESLYIKYGLFGLGIASFLEAIVYMGLYFPGSFIIVLAVFLSNGTFVSLFSISIVVTIAVTLASFINYFLGRFVSFNKINSDEVKKKNKLSKSFILSLLHPNILAFYFFNAGIKKQNPWKIIFVPIFMIPYGLMHAYILSIVAGFFKQKAENSWFILMIILIWLLIAFFIEHRRKNKLKRI